MGIRWSTIFSLAFLVACGPKSKYPNTISGFRPALKQRLDSIAAPGQLLYEDSTGRAFLRTQCSLEELSRLMNCDVPLLRVVAYKTLVQREAPNFFQLLVKHLDDTAKVIRWDYDDAAGEYQVSDLMISAARQHPKWTDAEKDSLVAVVVEGHRYLQHAYWMIEDMEPTERYHDILCGLLDEPLDHCNKERVVLALARFRRRSDLPLIRRALLDGEEHCRFMAFRAIETFPDTSLFIVLQRYFDEVVTKKKQFGAEDLRLYCRALVAYKDQRSVALLGALTKKETYIDTWYLKYNKEYLFKAIQRNPSPVYDGLRLALLPKMDSLTIAGEDYLDYMEQKQW